LSQMERLKLNSAGWWETPSGNIVISDAGYVNPPPPLGEIASTGAEDWVYASGPIFYETSEPSLFGLSQGLMAGSAAVSPWDRNTIVQWLTAYGILVFDTCAISAILVSYNVESSWSS